MSMMTKIWLAELYHKEIQMVNVQISDNNRWLLSSQTDEEAEMFTHNIASLEEYKQTLEELLKEVMEGQYE